jgi:hypothetical protein
LAESEVPPKFSLYLVHLCPGKSIVGHLRVAQSQTGDLRRQHCRIGDEYAYGDGILMNAGWTY